MNALLFTGIFVVDVFIGLYFCSHVICGVYAPFVSHDNHLRPMVARVLGFFGGPLGVWLVVWLNRREHQARLHDAGQLRTDFKRDTNPFFKSGGRAADPPPTAQAPSASSVHAPSAFAVPKAATWFEREEQARKQDPPA